MIAIFNLEIYLCFACGYPIIFRGHPPKMYHIGTGWYCWRKISDGEQSEDARPVGRFPFTTPETKRKKLLEQATRLYHDYADGGDAAPVLRFVRHHLKAGRSDVVHDLLVHVVDQEDRCRDDLVRRIVASAAWQEFVRSLKKKATTDASSGRNPAATAKHEVRLSS